MIHFNVFSQSINCSCQENKTYTYVHPYASIISFKVFSQSISYSCQENKSYTHVYPYSKHTTTWKIHAYIPHVNAKHPKMDTRPIEA